MKKSFTKTIECCAECDLFDNNGGMPGSMCDDQLRHPDGTWVLLDETIDPYEEIHADCPRIERNKDVS